MTELLVQGSIGTASEGDIQRAQERGREIERKTGLIERRFFDPDDDPVEVAYTLIVRLLKYADVRWDQLDGILISSSSIHGFPGLSQQVVARARERGHQFGDPLVFDLGSNACTSFMYVLGLADSLLATQSFTNLACIAIEFSSRCLDYHVRSFGISTLFGDAASGVLLSKSHGHATIRSVRLSSRIDGERIGYIRGSGCEASDLSNAVPANSRWFMSGPPVALDAIEILVGEVKRYQEDGVDIDWLIPHQGNLTRILYPACDRLGLPRDKLMSSFDRTGNTSSASIPFLIDAGVRESKFRTGQNVILVGFGASFSVASAHLTIG